MINQLLGLFIIFTIFSQASEPFCYFVSPKKWEVTTPHQRASHVKIGFIGKGKKGFHPSLNLASEAVTLSLTDYVKQVKSMHEADRKNHWRDLGKYQTASGEGRLTEIDTTTEWGATRLLQLLFIKERRAYILTACAIKEEFGDYYQEFQKAFRTLTILSDPLEALPHSPIKEALQKKINSYKQEPNHWESIQKIILNDYIDMGACWQIFTLKALKEAT